MCIKISKNEIDYAKRTSEEDRQRKILRQRAYRDVKATAEIYRRLPLDPWCFYQNSNGDRVGTNSLPISLC